VTKPYTEADVKAITLHTFGRSIAMGANVNDCRERVVKILDWLTDAGRLRSEAERDEFRKVGG
jgi:hypothetical protein